MPGPMRDYGWTDLLTPHDGHPHGSGPKLHLLMYSDNFRKELGSVHEQGIIDQNRWSGMLERACDLYSRVHDDWVAGGNRRQLVVDMKALLSHMDKLASIASQIHTKWSGRFFSKRKAEDMGELADFANELASFLPKAIDAQKSSSRGSRDGGHHHHHRDDRVDDDRYAYHRARDPYESDDD